MHPWWTNSYRLSDDFLGRQREAKCLFPYVKLETDKIILAHGLCLFKMVRWINAFRWTRKGEKAMNTVLSIARARFEKEQLPEGYFWKINLLWNRSTHGTVYPPKRKRFFGLFWSTSEEVKVKILGQIPIRTRSGGLSFQFQIHPSNAFASKYSKKNCQTISEHAWFGQLGLYKSFTSQCLFDRSC